MLILYCCFKVLLGRHASALIGEALRDDCEAVCEKIVFFHEKII